MGISLKAAEVLGREAWEAGLNRLAGHAWDLAREAIKESPIAARIAAAIPSGLPAATRMAESAKVPGLEITRDVASSEISLLERIWKQTITPARRDQFGQFSNLIGSVGRLEGKPVAFAMHGPTAEHRFYADLYPSSFLHQLSVDPKLHGQGIGRQMLADVVGQSEARGNLLFLGVHPRKPNAVGLYLTGHFEPFRLHDAGSHTYIEMAKQLKPGAWRELLDLRYTDYVKQF